jgi:secreted trypsin-like serine protease
MVVAFFVFVQSGEAAPQAADEQPPHSSTTPYIVGGREAPNGKYPFMAFIETQLPNNRLGSCVGTLIDRDSVLTAAHCLENASAAYVIVGRTVRSGKQGQIRWASRAFTHPSYNPKTLFYDVGVLKLERAVTGIKPIKLATSKQNDLETPRREATVAGWGNTFATSPPPPGPPEFPDRMHEAQVSIVSDSSAEQAYDPRQETRLTRGFAYSPPLMIAAGGKGKDTCQGDSGGPLFFALAPEGGGDNGDETPEMSADVEVILNITAEHQAQTATIGDNGGSSGKYTQIGITSEGAGCAYKDFPGLYTEVNNPSIRSFITNEASR